VAQSRLKRCLLAGSAAVGILAGCGSAALPQPLGLSGTQPSVAQPGLSVPSTAHADPKQSWMSPDAKTKSLLYISDSFQNLVYVFSYPDGTQEGTLTGFDTPLGLCVDKQGDVFITNAYENEILEYAHGGTTPIATLTELRYIPFDCSIDPTTGNLAVANYAGGPSNPGSVAIYRRAKGKATQHTISSIHRFFSCAYDSSGNLYADGTTYSKPPAFGFAELLEGAKKLKGITLDLALSSDYPGGVQWDGTYVAVGDYDNNTIYQFTIKGNKGTKVGSTPLLDAGEVFKFLIRGSTVVVPSELSSGAAIFYYNYPAGGSPTKTITLNSSVIRTPYDAAVSPSK
jgi:hypothetical protein